ncbi:MAG: aminoacyl-tRNA deacylase [Planctomycetia bacterium]|nr:aminoacyl-tRNA deacylase [Planctomycetia bacterium]
MSKIKTNVMRLLDQAGILYRTEIVDDVHDEDWSSLRTSKLLGVSADQIFKTLVLRGDFNRFLVCCIPSNQELNLKKVARASGDKKVELIHVKEIREITGYIRGGCSPIGMKKKFPTFFDETVILFDEIYINAGALDTMLLIAPNLILPFLEAKTADIID